MSKTVKQHPHVVVTYDGTNESKMPKTGYYSAPEDLHPDVKVYYLRISTKHQGSVDGLLKKYMDMHGGGKVFGQAKFTRLTLPDKYNHQYEFACVYWYEAAARNAFRKDKVAIAAQLISKAKNPKMIEVIRKKVPDTPMILQALIGASRSGTYHSIFEFDGAYYLIEKNPDGSKKIAKDAQTLGLWEIYQHKMTFYKSSSQDPLLHLRMLHPAAF